MTLEELFEYTTDDTIFNILLYDHCSIYEGYEEDIPDKYLSKPVVAIRPSDKKHLDILIEL